MCAMGRRRGTAHPSGTRNGAYFRQMTRKYLLPPPPELPAVLCARWRRGVTAARRGDERHSRAVSRLPPTLGDRRRDIRDLVSAGGCATPGSTTTRQPTRRPATAAAAAAVRTARSRRRLPRRRHRRVSAGCCGGRLITSTASRRSHREWCGMGLLYCCSRVPRAGMRNMHLFAAR